MATRGRWPDKWAMGADENNRVQVLTKAEHLKRAKQRNLLEREPIATTAARTEDAIREQ